jgi:hypothetical protein
LGGTMVQNVSRSVVVPNAGLFLLFWYDEAYSKKYNTSISMRR